MKDRNNIFTAILFSLTLLFAAAAPKAFGVVPALDGSYPGFNTAEGQNALASGLQEVSAQFNASKSAPRLASAISH